MSELSNGTPTRGERLLLVQSRMIDSLDDIGILQNSLARQVSKAMQVGGGSAFVVARQLWVLRDFGEDTHLLLFNAGPGLFVGREVTNAQGLKEYAKAHAHDAGNGNGTGKATGKRPGLYD